MNGSKTNIFQGKNAIQSYTYVCIMEKWAKWIWVSRREKVFHVERRGWKRVGGGWKASVGEGVGTWPNQFICFQPICANVTFIGSRAMHSEPANYKVFPRKIRDLETSPREISNREKSHAGSFSTKSHYVCILFETKHQILITHNLLSSLSEGYAERVRQ